MISKYGGTCFLCNKPTKAGVDHYDLDSKESFHEACRDNVPDPEALADSLGYRVISWEEILNVLERGSGQLP